MDLNSNKFAVADIITDYLINNDFFQFKKSITKFDNPLNEMFLSGLIDEIIILSDYFDIIPFVKLHRLYLFHHLYELNLDSKFNKSFNVAREFSLLSDKELLDKIECIVPNENLDKYIKLYAECFTRESVEIKTFLSKPHFYPLVTPLYEYAAYKFNSRKFYYSVALGKDNLVSHLLLYKVINSDSMLFNQATINTILSIFDLDFVQSTIINNASKVSVGDLSIFSRVICDARYRTYSTNESQPIICLSGQLRGGLDCLPFWIDFARKHRSPIFISTWDKAGIPTGAHGSKLTRMLPASVEDYFKTFDDKSFNKRYPLFNAAISNFDVKASFEKIVNDNKDVEIYYQIHDETLFDEEHIDFRKDRNQLKMFFNMHKCFKLAYKKNMEKFGFGNVIWARLDFKIHDLKYKFIFDNELKTSFSSFGNCCGDFLFQFNSKFLPSFLDLYSTFSELNPVPYFNHLGPAFIGNFVNYKGMYITKYSDLELLSGYLKSIKLSDKLFFDIASGYLFDDLELNAKISIYKELMNDDPSSYLISSEMKLVKTKKHLFIDLIRDKAVHMESLDVNKSIQLMKIAHELRPEGSFIKEKLEQYLNLVASYEKISS